jgi:hypothetical protein
MTLQDRRPRQQNFVRNEPRSGPVEQHAGPIRASPAQGVKPSIEPELGRAVGKFHVPAALPDFNRVVPPLSACTVLSKAVRMLDTQLSSKDRHHGGRSLRQIFRKRPDVTNGPELYREAKPIVIASMERDKAAVAVIKMKVAGEIF